MSEKKFRVWDKVTKTYPFIGYHVIGEVTVFSGIDQFIKDTWEQRKVLGYKHSIDAWNDFEEEQFTGLKGSKDHKDIYFGDKIKLEGDEDLSRFDGWIISDRNSEYIDLVSPDGKDGIPLFSFDYHASISEVIGNIRENPELAEKRRN